MPCRNDREGACRRDRGVLVGATAAELVHGHHLVRPVEQLRRHFGRHARELGDEDDRNGRGEGIDQVDPPLALEAVDQIMRQRGDPRPQPLDLAGDERAVDQLPQARVGWRLTLQHRQRVDGVERGEVRFWLGPAEFGARRDMEHFAPEAPIAQQRRRHPHARQAPEAIILPEEGRPKRAERVIGRIGVLHEGAVGRRKPRMPRRRIDRKGARQAHPSDVAKPGGAVKRQAASSAGKRHPACIARSAALQYCLLQRSANVRS